MILNPVIYYDPALFAARALVVRSQKEPKQRELRPRARTERDQQLAARLGITWKEYASQYVRHEVDMNFLSKYASDKYICIVSNEQPLAKVLQFPRGLIRRANLRKNAILRFEKKNVRKNAILRFDKKESLAEQLGIAVGSKNYESRRQLVNSFIQKRKGWHYEQSVSR